MSPSSPSYSVPREFQEKKEDACDGYFQLRVQLSKVPKSKSSSESYCYVEQLCKVGLERPGGRDQTMHDSRAARTDVEGCWAKSSSR